MERPREHSLLYCYLCARRLTVGANRAEIEVFRGVQTERVRLCLPCWERVGAWITAQREATTP